MIVNICITQEDIDLSLRDTYRCPLERSLSRAIGARVVVSTEHILFQNNTGMTYLYHTPKTLGRWLVDYSLGRAKPFNCTFRLEKVVDKTANPV